MKTTTGIILLLLSISCGQSVKQNFIPTADNSRTSIDWAGTYEGTLPCADCPGIYTSVQLTQQDSFMLRTKYTDKLDSVLEYKGTVTWSDDESAVQLIGDEHTILMWFKVGENKLMLLDQMGNEIESGWPESLLLHKIHHQHTDSSHPH
jgi:uncharacterized lipoprotein NlpE involved in copper resistance